jgi:2-iminobutanoate/2-iminopropanoate deaminase
MTIGPPYSAVVRAGDFLICSGQLGMADGQLAEGIHAQVSQAMHNIASLLATKSGGLHNIVKTTVFLADMADYAEMNNAYIAFFEGPPPARSAFAVAGLPFGALVEIEAWAYAPGSAAASL